MSAETEAVKHLHAVFLLTRNSADVQSDCRDARFIMMSFVKWLDVVNITFHWFTFELFSKCTKNVTIYS